MNGLPSQTATAKGRFFKEVFWGEISRAIKVKLTKTNRFLAGI